MEKHSSQTVFRNTQIISLGVDLKDAVNSDVFLLYKHGLLPWLYDVYRLNRAVADEKGICYADYSPKKKKKGILYHTSVFVLSVDLITTCG